MSSVSKTKEIRNKLCGSLYISPGKYFKIGILQKTSKTVFESVKAILRSLYISFNSITLNRLILIIPDFEAE